MESKHSTSLGTMYASQEQRFSDGKAQATPTYSSVNYKQKKKKEFSINGTPPRIHDDEKKTKRSSNNLNSPTLCFEATIISTTFLVLAGDVLMERMLLAIVPGVLVYRFIWVESCFVTLLLLPTTNNPSP